MFFRRFRKSKAPPRLNFDRLPLEIRYRIFGHLIPGVRRIDLTSVPKRQDALWSLSCTSKQLQRETRKFLLVYPDLKRTFYWGLIDVEQTTFYMKVGKRFCIRWLLINEFEFKHGGPRSPLWWWSPVANGTCIHFQRDLRHIHHAEVIFKKPDTTSVSECEYSRLRTANYWAASAVQSLGNLDTLTVTLNFALTPRRESNLQIATIPSVPTAHKMACYYGWASSRWLNSNPGHPSCHHNRNKVASLTVNEKIGKGNTRPRLIKAWIGEDEKAIWSLKDLFSET